MTKAGLPAFFFIPGRNPGAAPDRRTRRNGFGCPLPAA
jgi:hypothetical protein